MAATVMDTSVMKVVRYESEDHQFSDGYRPLYVREITLTYRRSDGEKKYHGHVSGPRVKIGRPGANPEYFTNESLSVVPESILRKIIEENQP